MAYTVKQISELSGLTVRALHFYEEEGILKPAYYGGNGYRYYEEKELLQLQQILFFKELGFSLKQIKKVLTAKEFNPLEALNAHKKSLKAQWLKIGELIQTVDKTINHLTGIQKMKDKELFNGFSLVGASQESSSYFLAEQIVLQSVKQHSYDGEKDLIEQAHGIFRELVTCIGKGLEPISKEVQKIIQRHYALTKEVQSGGEVEYKALAELYEKHPEFKKQMEPFHESLPNFMAKAMREFVEKNLS
jgi:DNA-binding transcriptional MerR regulator